MLADATQEQFEKEEGAKVVKRAVASIVDAVQQQLQALEAAGDQEAAIPADALAMLKKRNLIAVRRPPLPAAAPARRRPCPPPPLHRRGSHPPRAAVRLCRRP